MSTPTATPPKSYEIILLTPNGIHKETYKTEEKTLQQFENEMIEKYGTFIMHSSTELN